MYTILLILTNILAPRILLQPWWHRYDTEYHEILYLMCTSEDVKQTLSQIAPLLIVDTPLCM